MVGIALLGAGIFAKTAHLPAIEADPSLELKAVYSRSQKSAEDVASASKAASSVDVYYDTPSAEDKSLDALLGRSDITGVIIALPIVTQPAVIEKAIKAGKHVLSEKPVAADIAGAQKLIAWYDALPAPKPIWAVAENFRYIDALEYAAAKVKEIGGDLTTFRLSRHGYVSAEDKFFKTPWRKVPEYQGGFLLDGGVHFVAGLRMLLAAAGEEIGKLACFSGLLEERLVPVDTVNAVAVTKTGKTGSIAMSFGTEFKSGLEVEVVTTKGRVHFLETLGVRNIKVVRKNEAGEKVEEDKEFTYNSGVAAEVVAWGEAMRKGAIEERQSPAEALRDLEILQKLLESGEKGGEVQRIGL
ncbi:oxidoreductase-like protein [Cercophora newfieldiana]|uniref:Oxidoreductase-like protein n=1 Tax=Cercophora newfieldiana TaxID=92897 RepID=A0AA39XVQ2_9PEZI|nr:oxidoreductase-like protein [Cercophora newfieldiana]